MISAHSENTQAYSWPWLAAFGVFVLGLIYIMFVRPQIPLFEPRSPTATSFENNTYLLVHFSPVYSSRLLAPDTAESWLTALASKGYHPMLLSDVRHRLEQGQDLPDKTVVILFDPGYRITFEVMAPLLAKYKFPAVWITTRQAQRRSDTRYLSNHILKAMKKTGMWDVGYFEDESTLVMEPSGSKPFTIGNGKETWLSGAGRRALNRGVPTHSLNRLHINWNWTGQQIVDRLEAEKLLHGKGVLTLKRIQEHNWGIILPEASSQDSSFTFKAPSDSRTANLSWLGTKWRYDAQFNIEVKMLTGELWLLMRSDEEAGENIGVCFLNGKLSLTVKTHNESRSLLEVFVPSLAQPANFSAKVVLKGADLAVTVNGIVVAHTKNVPKLSSEEGIVRLTAYDKIAGAAHAESIKLTMSELQ